MKLSTKAQYGLKACFDLAEAYGRGPLSIARLSELTLVSPAYLEQLVMPLKRVGLLRAERGKDWRQAIDETAEVLEYGREKGIEMGGVIFGNGTAAAQQNTGGQPPQG